MRKGDAGGVCPCGWVLGPGVSRLVPICCFSFELTDGCIGAVKRRALGRCEAPSENYVIGQINLFNVRV